MKKKPKPVSKKRTALEKAAFEKILEESRNLIRLNHSHTVEQLAQTVNRDIDMALSGRDFATAWLLKCRVLNLLHIRHRTNGVDELPQSAETKESAT